MNVKRYLTSLVFASTAIAATCAFGQANVVENEPASIYVDASAGSDSNPGTQSQPVKTINAAAEKALANNSKGIGTHIWINPGVYRETVIMSRNSGQTSAPITLEAVQAGTAILDGADVVTGWAQSGGNGSIYTHSWSTSEGTCPLPGGWPSVQAIVRQREMVFINGQPLTQVLSTSAMQPNTFYLNTSTGQISIWPAAGVSVNNATVEVANRPQTLRINERSNMVVRGMVFQHATSCMNQHSVDVYKGNNILFDKVQANWNSSGGLSLDHSTYFTIQNSITNNNGAVGIAGATNKYGLYENNETDANNWRGAMGGFYDWAMGGMKLMQTHTATVDKLYSFNNKAQGLWFDTDNKNITISNSVLSGNLMPNLQLEADQGPIDVENTAFCSGGTGVSMLNATYVTLNGNTFYNNGISNLYRGQMWTAGQSYGRHITDWETGQGYTLITSHATITNNQVEDASSNQLVFGTYLKSSDWSKFVSTLKSNSNQWYDLLQSTAFGVTDGDRASLSNWRSTTGQDSNSTWTLPTVAASKCAVAPPF